MDVVNPFLTVFKNGLGAVNADNLNTFGQVCVNYAQLKGFIGLTSMQVYMQGFTSAGDGGQGNFVWVGTGTGTDDGGLTTIVPIGVTQGYWSRLSLESVQLYVTVSPPVTFSITIGPAYNQNYIPFSYSAPTQNTLSASAALGTSFGGFQFGSGQVQFVAGTGGQIINENGYSASSQQYSPFWGIVVQQNNVNSAATWLMGGSLAANI